MRVEGDEAKKFRAVCLSSLKDVNQGPLMLADDQTGEVKWLAKSNDECSKTLGPHAIRILRK